MQQEAQLEAHRKATFTAIDAEITDALSDGTLPKSPYVVKRIVETLAEAIELGYDVSVKDVMPLVKQQIQAELKDMFSDSPEEML
jgi:hypothetical protein